MSDTNVSQTFDDPDRQRMLESVIADYIRACDAGGTPDRDVILKQHPEIAQDLREFFVNRDQMQQLAQPFAPSVPPYEKSTLLRFEEAQPETRIGPYTLIQKLGEGGMGEVWVAKQSEPIKRKVALKLIKRGMNSRDVLARFEQERQALAMMDHPNIAKVFDGGVVGHVSNVPTDSGHVENVPHGQPYFVMELVNGLPLTKYCDEAKLTPRQRMELFIPVCQAVQHAHQKGIVHRDLKPSNILVTLYDGQPVPKVIDFGVAKALGGKLTDDAMSTQFGAVVGTLEYMSPEQAGFSGQDIDTRADIYSLGVILYELLTGLRPIDGQRLRKAALTELIRIIQEEEPSKPSTRLSSDASLPSLAALRQTEPKRLTALLRGELDWVVMKCLEKSRDRRYETANALSRDLQRYLADEPVEARPPSFNYRAGKFLRRHRGPVIAASLVLFALIVGIIGTTWGFVREAKQRDRAEKNQKAAIQAAEKESHALGREKVANAQLTEAHTKLKGEQAATQAALLTAETAKKEEHEQRQRVEGLLAEAKLDAYVNRLMLVERESAADNLKRASLILNECDEELRNWEWGYMERLVKTRIESQILDPGRDFVFGVAFSPDGRLLASAGGRAWKGGGKAEDQPGEVVIWDAATSKPVCRFA